MILSHRTHTFLFLEIYILFFSEEIIFGDYSFSLVRVASPTQAHTAMAPVALLVWLQTVAQASGSPVSTCPNQAGPEKMVVVASPTPYYSWDVCNNLVNAGKGYLTEPINETKHAGVVTKM